MHSSTHRHLARVALLLLCSFRTSLCALRVRPPGAVLFPRRRATCVRCSEADGAEWLEGEPAEDVVDDATVYRKRAGKGLRPYKPKDNRDKLLFDVTEVTPPPRRLGLFRLEPNTGCGDMIEVRDSSFVIKKVAYKYEFSGGAYRMVQKSAQVKETTRDAVEKFMSRMLDTPSTPDDSEGAGAQ